MTQNEIRLSAEILKTLFNITLNLPEPESTDTVEHGERIVFIVRSIFVHFKPLPEQPENLPNYAINVLSNMPTKCLKHLLWTMPSSVCKKLAQDYEHRISSTRFRIQFEVGNFQSTQYQEKMACEIRYLRLLQTFVGILQKNFIQSCTVLCSIVRLFS